MSLLFADDVVLLASSDLQHALGRFIAECEAAGMTVSTSKTETMVLSWKMVDCSLWVESQLLLQAKEFKYLRVLFTSEGKMELEMDRWIGAATTTTITLVDNETMVQSAKDAEINMITVTGALHT